MLWHQTIIFAAQYKFVEISDPLFRLHLGGRIYVQSKLPIATRETLSMA